MFAESDVARDRNGNRITIRICGAPANKLVDGSYCSEWYGVMSAKLARAFRKYKVTPAESDALRTVLYPHLTDDQIADELTIHNGMPRNWWRY